MAQKSLKNYITKLQSRCRALYDESFIYENEELIRVTASNQRLLDRFDGEIDSKDLTVLLTGSMGQTKEEINPIIKYRNDVAKLLQDNLDALMLTQRARFKKTEGTTTKKEDKLAELLNKIN